MISCKEAVARLWTYLDRALGASQERELEEHLGLCRHCCGELEFARQVRERLRASGAAAALTPEAQERLDGFLKRLAVGEKEGR
ncbi:MAG TPA: zf-HC2 domain-containing protein [bacterium]|nr:zf-HC2 domain-containing protein [bacterium]